jgi:flagellar assembly factor FliW
MKCFNRQIGEIDYQENHVFTFAEGLIGFDRLHSFVVINDAEAEPFRWLVSVEDEDICLPLLDPKFIIPEYEVINRFDDGLTVAVVASLRDPIEESTVNMRSPILFDAVSLTGQQVILPEERFGVQQKFIGQSEQAPVTEAGLAVGG